jgi:hypothetical protein
MRMTILAAFTAIAFASAASGAQEDYRVDANGKCHAANGQFTYQKNCAARPPTYTLDAKGRCHASNGQFAPASKCRH